MPRPERARLHLNLWKLDGTPVVAQEVIFQDFTFPPANGATAVGPEEPGSVPAAQAGRLLPSSPNPFNPNTTSRFELVREQAVRLDVYDLSGRRLRSLADGRRSAGEHELAWNGRGLHRAPYPGPRPRTRWCGG